MKPLFLGFLAKSLTTHFVLVNSTYCVHTLRSKTTQDRPALLSREIFCFCVNYNDMSPNTESQSYRGNQDLHSVSKKPKQQIQLLRRNLYLRSHHRHPPRLITKLLSFNSSTHLLSHLFLWVGRQARALGEK